MKKVKLLVVFLCIVMVFYNFSALANEKNDVNDMISEALCLESQDKDSIFYGESDISIGTEIDSYKILDGNVMPTESRFYPVFISDVMVCIASISFTENAIETVELSGEFVEEIKSYGKEKVALVFDNISTYILCNDEIKLLKSYENMITIDEEQELLLKDSIDYLSQKELKEIKTSQVTPKYEVDFNNHIEDVQLLDNEFSMRALSYPTYKYLSVPIVPQNGLPICWAASVASIGNYKTSSSETAEDVSDWVYGQNQGGNSYIAAYALEGIFDLSSVDVYYAPDFSIIKSEISNDDPMYVRLYGVSGSTTINHALTFIGYYDYSSGTYDGKIRYNDSNYSSYKTVYFKTSGVYNITYNGVASKIDQYVTVD